VTPECMHTSSRHFRIYYKICSVMPLGSLAGNLDLSGGYVRMTAGSSEAHPHMLGDLPTGLVLSISDGDGTARLYQLGVDNRIPPLPRICVNDVAR